ncbi:MAG: hypothetical protein IPK83_25090 [Planctomycetes bacterium]|nr:hypothetical protein [Planctomycetota bacterium]
MHDTMFHPFANRLIAISPTDPEEGDLRTEMVYDYMGRRVRKLIREWVMLVPPPASPYPEGTWGWDTESSVDDMRYIYDGWNLVIEHRLADRHSVEDFAELTTRKFAWGCDLAGLNGGAASGNVQSAVHGAGGIGGLLAMEDTAYEDPYADDPKYLYFFDGNGNVMQLVVFDDGGAVANTPPPLAALMYDGFVFASYEYDPYGGTLLAADWLGVDNPFRFSTKFYDAQPSTAAAGERGLYYYGYRYYSPRLGRWVNRDPIEEVGGFLLQGFVKNRPNGNYDALGLSSFIEWAFWGNVHEADLAGALIGRYMLGNGQTFQMTEAEMHEAAVFVDLGSHKGLLDAIDAACKAGQKSLSISSNYTGFAQTNGTLNGFQIKYSGIVKIKQCKDCTCGWEFKGTMSFYDVFDFDLGGDKARSKYGWVATTVGNLFIDGKAFSVTSVTVPIRQSCNDKEAQWSGTGTWRGRKGLSGLGEAGVDGSEGAVETDGAESEISGAQEGACECD